MSIETTPAERAQELGRELGQAIATLPVYERFEEAKAAVEADEEAQEKIRQFQQRQQEFLLARQTGEAADDDLRRLREAQGELHDVPVMREFLQAQSELELRLEEVNEAISEPLAVDFGEKAGGCCQD